jgi:hypothetical protein
MRYVLRIAGMIIGVVVLSAALAAGLSQWVAVSGVGDSGMFVGLTVSGLVAAIFTREFWLPA